MSRTHKDRHWKLRFPEETFEFGYNIDGTYRWLKKPGVKTKKKRNYRRWEWLQSTPSWWTRVMMHKPQRRKCRLWERTLHYQDIEEADCPFFKNKPHVYFY